MTTILVVDDSAVDRCLVGELLKSSAVCTVEYAASGLEALARLKDVAPDLVVTDLAMPLMDGLELVKVMRAEHPQVPVILMTAYGSESLAMRALQQGAASYVPKSQLAQKLATITWEVLVRADAERSANRFYRCLAGSEFRFALDNDARLIDPLLDLVQQMAAATGLCDFAGRVQIGIALRHAILNALFHGNLELSTEQLEQLPADTLLQENELSLVDQRCSQAPYRDRKIFIELRFSPGEARFVVRDEGAGFDWAAFSAPIEPDAVASQHGRGLVLMRTFMDEVHYNDPGNEVTMLKRRRAD